ncbi:MAG: tRNA (adenosine(37)-N6)-dimethylallyltransferase MiaA [Alphaproteobacteria bacterium]
MTEDATGERPHDDESAGRPYIVVAGPTASGKSALAMAIAESFNGQVINADSMQVYRELSILTARPTPADEARVPHALYGVLSVAEPCSVARWLALAREAAAAARAAGRLPVFVGGTGLYLRALMVGLSPIPDIPGTVRAAGRALMSDLGAPAFHARLAGRDPVMAARLHRSDSQRLVRAWEVLEVTGRSLAVWQDEPPGPDAGPVPGRPLILVRLPPRETLYRACDARFAAMVAAGALDEVRALAALDLPPDLPAMKALGVPELLRHVTGGLGLDEAVSLAQAATRHYAKRQCTWFRHQMPTATVLTGQYSAGQYSESLGIETYPVIRQFLLTDRT